MRCGPLRVPSPPIDDDVPPAHTPVANDPLPGRRPRALQCYNATLRLKPDHPHAYNNLGNAMKDRGRITEAMRCYSMACKLMPNFAAAHSNLACVLKDQGDVRGALTHYLRAIRIDPNFADAYRCVPRAPARGVEPHITCAPTAT